MQSAPNVSDALGKAYDLNLTTTTVMDLYGYISPNGPTKTDRPVTRDL